MMQQSLTVQELHNILEELIAKGQGNLSIVIPPVCDDIFQSVLSFSVRHFVVEPMNASIIPEEFLEDFMEEDDNEILQALTLWPNEHMEEG